MNLASDNFALEVDDLSLSIGGAKILESISLKVEKNEILGIIGPNGAGKTSLFNLLSGLRAPSKGSIYLHGKEITKFSPAQRARAGIARTFQTSSVFTNLTVLENVRLAAHAADKNSMDLRRNAYKFPDVLAAAQKCLEMVGLSAKALSIAGSLAHGDKRRLEIAIVLAAKSDVVL
ncbi:MAG: ATP-binding cassette domain-containing protein, partial [Actinomycetota bacterium]